MPVRQTGPRQINKNAYEVGKDLGTAPGAVVYRNKLFELIQYSSEQGLVRKRPVLVVPPQINKFYVFDLSPKNSLVEHLRRNGLQVFMVSWKNPTKAEASAGLDTYLEELDKGVQAVLDITGSPDLSLASACAGGITAVSLQALYASQGKKLVRNHSVLVTALNVEDHPTLDLFMDKRSVALSLARSYRRGAMEGKELAHVFAWLRPTDLVWNYRVNNNLLGKEPPNMDVLYWDNDSTRLPAALHHDFMDIFVNDRFAKNTLSVKGRTLDLGKVSMTQTTGASAGISQRAFSRSSSSSCHSFSACELGAALRARKCAIHLTTVVRWTQAVLAFALRAA